jgi:hypothetical protein
VALSSAELTTLGTILKRWYAAGASALILHFHWDR